MNRNGKGHQIGFSLIEHLNQASWTIRYLHGQFQPHTLGKVFGKVILISHILHLILEIGG